MYYFVICTSHFLSNARFYRLQTALENKTHKKKTKTPATHEWGRFYFHWNLEFLTLELSLERKNIENSNVEQTNAKHRIFIVKPPLSTTQNCHPSAVIGGVPCKNANFACNVISEAGSLAVEKQWFHWLSGWNVVLIAYLWLFLLFSGRNSFYLIIFLSKSRKT